MGISLDGMSAVLLEWVPCSIVHPLMGISLDGRSKTPVLLMICFESAQFKKNTSVQAGIQSMKVKKGITK